MAKEPWEIQYPAGNYDTILVGGSTPRQGILPGEIDKVMAYLTHRAGPPVYEDTCSAPTLFSPATFILEGVAVVVRRPFTFLQVKGSSPDLERTVDQLTEDLGLRRKVQKKK